jgi:hypothetical protein
MVCQPVHAGGAAGSSYTVHLSKVGFPLLISSFFIAASKRALFTKGIIDIADRNFIYGLKVTIVIPVSSTLPKDGFSPPRSFRWAFFCQFPIAQRRNPQSITMRVSLSSLPPAHRRGFCGRIMQPNTRAVYMQCNIVQWKRKSPPE